MLSYSRYLCPNSNEPNLYKTSNAHAFHTTTNPNYTGSSAFLLPPANVSNPCLIYGPTTGIFPANWPIVMRKSPNNMKSPYSSMINPVSGQRRRIREMPARKATVPLIFWRRVKKAIVLFRPIIRLRPTRNRT